MTHPKVSLVVPSRDGNIDKLRDSLSKQTLKDYEFVIKVGFAPPSYARNAGAAEAKGDYIIFLDDDIQFNRPDALERVVYALDHLEPYDVVQIDWKLAPDVSDFQRGLVELKERMVYESPKGVEHPSAGVVECPWPDMGTRCFALRRSAFAQVNGFDEKLIAGEDPELAYRLTLLGGKTYSVKDCWVLHWPPETFKKAVSKKIWYQLGNAQVSRKHPGARYRIVFKNGLHAAGYLALRTAAIVPLTFIRVRPDSRKPVLSFRPVPAIISYIGAWAYFWGWYFAKPARPRAINPSSQQTRLQPA